MGDGHTAATGFLMALQAALGWKVFCVDGIPWCRYGIATAMTIPLTEIHPVGWSQAERILRESGCLLAQFPTSANTGVAGKRYVLLDKNYGEASLQRQFRQMVRRGDQHLTFRELTWDELALDGPATLDAYRLRQGMKLPVADRAWSAACDLGKSASEFVVLGCRHEEDLAAFEIFQRRTAGYQSVCTVVHPGFFKFGAANLLLYRSARTLIGLSDCEYVNFGRSGIPAIEGHDRFHRHAGLTEQPLRMAAVLHPRLKWLGHIEKCTSCCSTLRVALGSASRFARHLEALAAAAATNPNKLPK